MPVPVLALLLYHAGHAHVLPAWWKASTWALLHATAWAGATSNHHSIHRMSCGRVPSLARMPLRAVSATSMALAHPSLQADPLGAIDLELMLHGERGSLLEGQLVEVQVVAVRPTHVQCRLCSSGLEARIQADNLSSAMRGPEDMHQFVQVGQVGGRQAALGGLRCVGCISTMRGALHNGAACESVGVMTSWCRVIVLCHVC